MRPLSKEQFTDLSKRGLRARDVGYLAAAKQCGFGQGLDQGRPIHEAS